MNDRLAYDPAAPGYLCFAHARRAFADGTDDPRCYLETCIERIEAREAEVQAFVTLNLEGARRAADASAARYRAGRALSPVDGLPVAIKDLFETEDMPTAMNSAYFDGWQSGRDAAHVFALRRGGALIVGKTVTTELGMAAPGPTRNPWDLRRTPGGSSSGAAAAVAAGMVPVATGSQVRGSIVRPASICGVIGNKPTFGAIHPGGGLGSTPSVGHVGMLAGTLIDCWESTYHIAVTVGGAPGHPGLYGQPGLPPPRRPRRLLRQYTAGWSRTDAASQAEFERFLGTVAQQGIEIVEPESDAVLAACEALTLGANEVLFDVMAWEGRWPLLHYVEKRRGAFGATVLAAAERTAGFDRERYRAALVKRAEFRAAHAALRGKVDGFITLAHMGPGQIGLPAVGTPWFNDASSLLGAPSYNLPLLRIEGVPLGIQLMGFDQEDEELTGLARWFLDTFAGAGLVAT